MNQLHPVMEQALRPWMPPTAAKPPRPIFTQHISVDDDDVTYICDACSGSGEGRYEGSTCYFCRGTGEV